MLEQVVIFGDTSVALNGISGLLAGLKSMRISDTSKSGASSRTPVRRSEYRTERLTPEATAANNVVGGDRSKKQPYSHQEATE